MGSLPRWRPTRGGLCPKTPTRRPRSFHWIGGHRKPRGYWQCPVTVKLGGPDITEVGPLLPEQWSVLPTFARPPDGPESRWYRLVILCNRGARPCDILKILSPRLRAANPGSRAN